MVYDLNVDLIYKNNIKDKLFLLVKDISFIILQFYKRFSLTEKIEIFYWFANLGVRNPKFNNNLKLDISSNFHTLDNYERQKIIATFAKLKVKDDLFYLENHKILTEN